MGRLRWFAAVLVATLAALGLGACGGGGSSEHADVVATGFTRFDPDQLSTRLNRQTTFSFRNDDKSREHNFTISYVFTDATQTNNVSVDVKPGETKDVTFTVTERPATGYLTFYCRFHQSDGMSGKIKIT